MQHLPLCLKLPNINTFSHPIITYTHKTLNTLPSSLSKSDAEFQPTAAGNIFWQRRCCHPQPTCNTTFISISVPPSSPSQPPTITTSPPSGSTHTTTATAHPITATLPPPFPSPSSNIIATMQPPPLPSPTSSPHHHHLRTTMTSATLHHHPIPRMITSFVKVNN
nr:hypothetical protein [Tanacetum cinerariifolium]